MESTRSPTGSAVSFPAAALFCTSACFLASGQKLGDLILPSIRPSYLIPAPHHHPTRPPLASRALAPFGSEDVSGFADDHCSSLHVSPDMQKNLSPHFGFCFSWLGLAALSMPLLAWSRTPSSSSCNATLCSLPSPTPPPLNSCHMLIPADPVPDFPLPYFSAREPLGPVGRCHAADFMRYLHD